jgi:hypothetical protein
VIFRPGGLSRRVAALAAACLAGPVAATVTPIAAHAGATVAVVSSSQWGPDATPFHYWHWAGEVRNNGDTTSKPYNASVIRVTANDASGHAVDTVDADAAILGPGQRSPFDIPMAAQCVGCTLSVSFAPTADPPNHKFSISPNPLNIATDGSGTQHFTGTVTNNNTTPADYVKVILTFYDGTGMVVDEDHLPLNNTPTSTLNAGQSAPFEAIRSKEHPAYTSMVVSAESLSAPSLPIVTPSSSPFDIGGVHVGSTGPKAMTITNTGNDDLHISPAPTITGTNASEFGLDAGKDTCTGSTVSPNATCSIGMTFTPTAIGVRTAVLNLADDSANNPEAIPIQGTGQAPDISASGIDFGDTVEGRPGHKSVVVTNVGNADLHIDTTQTKVPSGTDFSADPSGCAAAVPAGQSCSIAITFAPTAVGPESTTLTVAALALDSAFHSPMPVTIRGTGTNPSLSLAPPNLDFGILTVGAPSGSKTVTVSNAGQGNMHVIGVSVLHHPTEYAISGCSGPAATVAQSGSCLLTIVFTAQAAGDQGDTLTVTSDASNSPKTVSLAGQGSGALAVLDSAALDFSKVYVGTSSSTKTVTLTNQGNKDLTLTAITSNGDYSQTNDCGAFPALLHPGNACHATVTFGPSTDGTRASTLSFVDNSSSSTHQDVALTGIGVVASTGWQPLGGSLASSPAATSWGPNRLDVFAKGQDGALYHMWWDGATWHYWERLGGSLTSDPAAVSWGPNRLDIFATGRDRAVYHMWTADGGATWQPWERLGGTLASNPTASTWGPGRLDLFAAGQDKAMYHMWSTDGGVSWQPWERLGGSLTSDPAAVSWGLNRIDVFARGRDLALYHMSSTDGSTFSDWLFLGGSLSSDPVASSWGPNRIDVFAAGRDTALYHMSSDDGATFTPWGFLGGKLTSNPAGASPQKGRIDLFARGLDLGLYHMILGII